MAGIRVGHGSGPTLGRPSSTSGGGTGSIVASGQAGPPTVGTYTTNTLAYDTNYLLWVCSAGGTPGTWQLASKTALPSGTAGAPSAGTWQTDQLVVDSTANVWWCTAGGTPGTWKLVGPGTTIPSTTQTGNYSLALSDSGTRLRMNAASGVTVTFTKSATVAWATGTVIEICQVGTGQVTCSPDTGVTLNSDGTKVHTGGQFATIGALYDGSDVWYLSGDLV